jgi:phosphate transport system protein
MAFDWHHRNEATMTKAIHPTDHIVRSYDAELERLTGEIQRMGELALRQLRGAIDAVMDRDSDKAMRIVKDDAAIDALEHDIGQDVVRLLALRQPMARDLREVLAALRIAADIERIGDYAANVAKRSIALNRSAKVELANALPRLARLAENLVAEVLAAYATSDAGRAIAAWTRDEELDEQYTGLFRELLTYMMEDPRTITACTHLLFMAKNLERIGDHATNIAEDIHFLVNGTPNPQMRRKGDTTIALPVDDPR